MASSSDPSLGASALGTSPSTSRKRHYATIAEPDEDEVKEEPLSDDESDESDESDKNEEESEGWADTTGPHHAGARAPAYDGSVDVMFDESRRRLQSVIELVERYSLRASSAQTMLDKLWDLQQTPVWTKFRILLVGSSGTGKSSIINNLLDMPSLTKALDTGKRCTDVPTIYEAPLDGQTKAFAAQVQFRSPQVIEKLLHVLLSNFYLWHCESEDGWSEDRRDVIRRTAESAINICCEMFKGKPGFMNQATAIEWLTDRRSIMLDLTVSLLYSWCEEILAAVRDNKTNNDIGLVEAATATELRVLVKHFSHSNSRSDKAQLWPLVEQIRVGIQGRELLQYITIVDCPGSSDDDGLRSEAFERMIHGGCHELWIVDRIGRIASERIVASMLATYGKHLPVLVIATAIDDNVSDGLCEEYEDGGLDVEDLRAQIRLVTRLSERSSKLKRSIQRQSKRRRVSTSNEQRALTTASNSLRELQDQLRSAQQHKFERFVNLRLQYIIRELRDKYGANVAPDEILEIHGVSNKHYAEGKGGLDPVSPRLALSDTGIPSLRKHIFMKEAVASNKIQALRYYLNGDLAALLQSFDSLLQPSASTGHTEMSGIFTSASHRLNAIVSERLQTFPGTIDDGITSHMVRSIPAYLDHAIVELNKRRKWNHQTAKAFIWKNGRHSTRREPFRQSWDQHFSEAAVAALQTEWSSFAPQLDTFLDDFELSILDVLDQLKKEYNGRAVCENADRKRFKDTTTAYTHRTRRELRLFRSTLRDSMKSTVVCAVTDSAANYFSCAMFAAYKKCQDFTKGRGIMERYFDALESHIRSTDGLRTPFEVMIVRFCETLEKNFETSARELLSKLVVLMNEMRNDLLEIVDADADTAILGLRPDLARAKADFEQWIVDSNGLLAQLESRYAAGVAQ
ncbi:hypothetical protein LTR78_009942 [Recurvomyces mirabilis]|uniref:DUF7605 domain-containing protein n=1 Tax=Recurvomyces mirabilis TaxID=574656 RepID=A0AAE0TT10_9PEZI|nr:hypothetical protein LTR78_009942 [Recurvomyces mirabilis]KAK5160374.1 hypothetical protein LTS14_001386 [Recurvomyces mirabilis]